MAIQTSQYNIFQQLTSVRVTPFPGNITGLYSNGPLNNGVKATLTALTPSPLVIDGTTLNINDRVALTSQTNANENGIYVVTSTNWVLTRSDDFQCIEQMKAGQFVFVGGGSSNAGYIFIMAEPLPVRLGIDPLNLAQAQ